MAQLTSTLVVRMLDQVSGPARTAAQAILGIGDAASRAGRTFSLTDRITGAIQRNNAALEQTRGQLVDAVAGFYALKSAIGGPVVMAAEFESSMNRVAAVSDATEEQLKELTEQALALGRSTRYTAAQAADAQNFLAMAGFRVNEILGAMPGTLQLAAAAQMDLGTAADIVSNVLTGYGMKVEELGRVNDVLVKAFTRSNTDLQQLGEAMKYAGPVASAAGIQFEEAAAALGLMGNAGIQASMAGTSLRGAITRILNPSKEVSGIMADLGLEFVDTAGRIKPLNEIIEQLGPHADNAGLFMELFGQRAGPAMMALVSQGAQALREMTVELENAGGTAERIAERQIRGTLGLGLALKSAWEDVQIAIGNSLLPALNQIMEVLIPVLNRLSQFVSENPKLVAAIVGAAGAFIGLKVALIGVRYAALLARGGLLSALLPLVKIGAWVKAAAAGNVALQSSLAGMAGLKFGGLAKAAAALKGIAQAIPVVGGVLAGGISAPVVVALGAIAAAGALIYKYWDRISSLVSGFAGAIASELSPAIEAAKPYLEWLAPIGDAIAAGWEKAKAVISAFGEWFRGFFAREALSEEEKAQWAEAGADAARRMVEAIKSVLTAIVEWARDLGSKIGSAIGSAATGAINRVKGAVSGAVSTVKGWVSGGEPEARAMGGPVRRGETYLVGERGPELWTAPGSGRIIPHNETMRLLRDFRGGLSSPASTRRAGAASVTVNAPITISGVADAKEAAREVARVMVETVGDALRGVHADVGVA